MSYGTIKTSAPASDTPEASPLLAANGNPAASDGALSGPETSQQESQNDNNLWVTLKSIYNNNIGLFLVFLAQMFGSIVSEMTLRQSRRNFMMY